MILYINDNKTVADLQEKFSACFPNLKIQFYGKPHYWHEVSADPDFIPPHKTLGAIRKNHEPGVLNIKSWYAAGKVERAFEKFGLHVQVFRKTKYGWMQTSIVDDFTLWELSQIGGPNGTIVYRAARERIVNYDPL